MYNGQIAFVEQQPPCSTRTLVSIASLATAMQYSWALQISHLNPYVQSLGVPHTFSSLVWVYGAVTGLIIQPILGYRSDRCTSRFGRRRPYIVIGVLIASVAYILIGYAKDIGYYVGDTLEKGAPKPRAVTFFIIGYWLLDIASNVLQGPSRALLADLCMHDHQNMRKAMSWFSFFMAVGNVLGYLVGAFANIHLSMPFTKTEACRANCANIKTSFFIALVLLWILTINALPRAIEIPVNEEYVRNLNSQQPKTTSWVGQTISLFRTMERPVRLLLLVTALNWLGLFPILLFGTDWVGKEVFKGNIMSGNQALVERYEVGVRVGSMGLMFNSVVLALMSLMMEKAGYLMGGMRRLWAVGNMILAGGYLWTLEIAKAADVWWRRQPNDGHWDWPPMMDAAWILFAILGISLAVTYSIPFAMASIYCSIYGGGQGLSLGLLNLAIVTPQMLVALMAGPVDLFMSGGNLPLFMVATGFAIVSAFLALFVLPEPDPEQLVATATALSARKKPILL